MLSEFNLNQTYINQTTMKRAMYFLSAVLCTMLLASCDEDDFFDLDPLNRTYVTLLTPEQEAQFPPVESDATGKSEFVFSKDGKSVKFKIEVTNLEGVTMAHLHYAPFGENGPVVVTLLPPQDPSGLVSGTLVSGYFLGTDQDNKAGIKTLEELREAIDEGRIYVNVHTDDYPAGEIRGQL
jgi:hypothetical protein